MVLFYSCPDFYPLPGSATASIVDEYCAEGISQRAKESVKYRKSKGITIGRPPFGTVRNGQGQLVPSSHQPHL